MNIAFYIGEMNFRGVVTSTYNYAFYNEKILKNKSVIFYDNKNKLNKNEVIKKFKKNFKMIGINNFFKIEKYKKKLDINYVYIQKGANNNWTLKKINTIVHSVYPQKFKDIHGNSYAYISEWLSKKFSNYKISYVPLILELNKTKKNLKKELKINKNQIVFGTHGGESSFDLQFVKDTVFYLAKIRKDITFVFLNINKFINHPRVIFLKGTSNDIYKKKFLNTCDAMLYGRSLGESFGLACGEFSILGKKIISYKFNRHKSHKFNLNNKNYIEYSSKNNLFQILNTFKKNKKSNILLKVNKYTNCNSRKVMKKFNEVFLKKNNISPFTYLDYFINYLNFLFMNYNYIRHKIYDHYYKYFESKFIFKKD